MPCWKGSGFDFYTRGRQARWQGYKTRPSAVEIVWASGFCPSAVEIVRV